MKKKLRILYITYIDFSQGSSGSSVRPQKMYKSFVEYGADVILLYGSQPYKGKGKERNKRIKEILKIIKKDKPDLCYIESTTYPIYNLYDLYLLIKLKKYKIPTSYFYRDAYWKFGMWDSIKGIKRIIFRLLYAVNNILLKYCCNIVYFPSESMAKYFKFKDMRPLPPAGNNNLHYRNNYTDYDKKDVLNCIYVGGVPKRYGVEDLLNAVCKVNNKYNNKLHLTFISRKEEADNLLSEYADKSYIYYKNLEGDDLITEYAKNDFAIIPIKKTLYNDFAIAVKLFEYLSFGLPVLATDCIEIEKFVTENDIGIITNDNVEDMSKKLGYIIENKYILNKYAENAKKTLLEKNLWIHRVEQIINDLKG